MEPQADIPLNPRIMLVVWGAFLNACLIYVVILFVISPGDPSDPPGDDPSIISWVVMAGGLALSAMIGFAAGIFKPAIAGITPSEHLRNAQLKMILRSAVFESIAIYGLVGNMGFGQSRKSALYFMAASFLLILVLLPGIVKTIQEYEKMCKGEYPIEGRRPLGGG